MGTKSYKSLNGLSSHYFKSATKCYGPNLSIVTSFLATYGRYGCFHCNKDWSQSKPPTDCPSCHRIVSVTLRYALSTSPIYDPLDDVVPAIVAIPPPEAEPVLLQPVNTIVPPAPWNTCYHIQSVLQASIPVWRSIAKKHIPSLQKCYLSILQKVNDQPGNIDAHFKLFAFSKHLCAK